MIAGLEEITAGTVEIGGRVVNNVAARDRDIAMVFQSYALYPHMSVYENMAFGLRLRSMPEELIRQRVNDAARILGLEELLDRLPRAMSGGQRQRVAMGRAIVREPQAFLMDEPLSNLDAKLRVQMRTQIALLHQRLGTTTVYVTHDQVEAMTLGQRICILRKGVVQQVDTPFMVYANPANIFVGGFIGSPGMNFFTGVLTCGPHGATIDTGQGVLQLPTQVAGRLLHGGPPQPFEVVVGIRPEHLQLAPEGSAGSFDVTVDLVETLGNDAYAYVTTNLRAPDLSALSDTQAASDTFVARIEASSRLSAGTTATFVPRLDHIHIFDPHTQQTLLSPIDQDTVHAIDAGRSAAPIVIAAPTVPQVQPEIPVLQPVPVAVPEPAASVAIPASTPSPAPEPDPASSNILRRAPMFDGGRSGRFTA
jgi:multiple sugar transport system ATP-binding protein